MKKDNISLIFWGTPEFALPSLKVLQGGDNFELMAVFTQPDQKVGRHQEFEASAVKKWALERNISVFQEKTEFERVLTEMKPDLSVVVAYGGLIPGELLEIPGFKTINLHPSLLPKYRGAAPFQTALLNGDAETGVTVMKLTEKLDAGPVFGQREFTISEDMLAPDLELKLAELGAELLVEVIPAIVKENLSPTPQDEKQVTFCSKITREDGEIDWKGKTAGQIFNQYRAFYGWPGVYTVWGQKRLKILEMAVLEENLGELGQVTVRDDEVLVAAKEGALKLLRVQLEGKTPVSIAEFWRGYPDFAQAKLG